MGVTKKYAEQVAAHLRDCKECTWHAGPCAELLTIKQNEATRQQILRDEMVTRRQENNPEYYPGTTRSAFFEDF